MLCKKNLVGNCEWWIREKKTNVRHSTADHRIDLVCRLFGQTFLRASVGLSQAVSILRHSIETDNIKHTFTAPLIMLSVRDWRPVSDIALINCRMASQTLWSILERFSHIRTSFIFGVREGIVES